MGGWMSTNNNSNANGNNAFAANANVPKNKMNVVPPAANANIPKNKMNVVAPEGAMNAAPGATTGGKRKRTRRSRSAKRRTTRA